MNSMLPETNRGRVSDFIATDSKVLESLETEVQRVAVHQFDTHTHHCEQHNEASIRQTEELHQEFVQYQKLFNKAPVGYCTLSKDGMIVTANQTIATLLGVNQSDLIEKPFLQYIYPEDRKTIPFHLTKTINGSAEVYELRMMRSDRSIFPVCFASALLNEQDSDIWVGVTITDISTLYKNNKRSAINNTNVHPKHEFLQKVMDALPFDVYWKDLSLTYLSCNLRFAKNIGFEIPEELIGFDDFHILDMPRASSERQDDLEVLYSGIPQLFREEEVSSPDGSQRWLCRSKLPLLNEDGSIIGLLGINEDITAQKCAQSEHLRSQKFQVASQLFNGISNDLNRIFTSTIATFPSGYYRNPSLDTLWTQLIRVEDTIFDIAEIICQFAVLSSKEFLRRQTFSLSNLMQSYACVLLKKSATSYQLSIPDVLWLVDADEALIQQALTHILLNVCNDTPKEKSINIVCENIHIMPGDILPLQEGKYVRLTLHDSTDCIAKDSVGKIFFPYFSTKPTYQGMCLIEALAIIKKYHGHITVQNFVGAGTTMTLYLPASDENISLQHSNQSEVQHSSKRVLIMDDDLILLDMVGIMLEHLGYKAVFALDGQEALEIYSKAMQSESPFDAVILDLVIPMGMGGRETMQKLLEMDPQAKVIVSSGYIHNSAMDDYENYGFKDVLSKPYRISKLEEVLTRLCGNSQRQT